MIYFKIHYQNQTHEMAMDSSQTILQVKHKIDKCVILKEKQ